ncbi:mediator of RNA polymerase II transcription subunit 1 like protein, partial [Tanacetum coccineum]
MRRICLCTAVYFVWQERNARIFRGEVRTVDDLFSTIIDTIKTRVVKFKVKRSKAVKTLERNWELKFLVKSMMMPSSVLLPSLIVSGVAAVGLCGTSKYKIIVIVVVVGYGYAWWKGWKLPNMMFATKRSLSDAMNVVAKKLDDVYSSLA